jgi:long-chain acyl-CoA synthetase
MRRFRTIPPMQIDGSTLERPAPPLNELLRAGLEARPEEVALVSAERSLTWRELDAESARLAGGYRGLGLEVGDRLASLMPNRIDLVVHYLACFRAGLIATPLNYRYTYREIDHALEVSGAKALLAHAERVEDVGASRLASELELGTVAYSDGGESGAESEWSHGFATLLGHDPLPDEPPPDPGEPAAISLPRAVPGRPRASPIRASRCAG